MKKKFTIKIFTINIVISFFFTSIFILLFYFFCNDKTTYYTSLINTTANKTNSNTIRNAEYNGGRIIKYPAYGTKYGTIKIDSIDLSLPLYYGDSLKILRYGVGNNAGSYMPGEGGSVILAAHNNVGFFHNLDKVKVGDEIIIETNYGTFNYTVDNYKVVKETDLDAFPITKEKEMLVLYTCYPIREAWIGRKTQRYVVYAYRAGEK